MSIGLPWNAPTSAATHRSPPVFATSSAGTTSTAVVGLTPSGAAKAYVFRGIATGKRKPRLGVIGAGTFARTFLLQAFSIPTGSMEPSLRAGEHLLVNKFVYGPTLWWWERRWLPLRTPRRGDVVVFRFPRDPRRLFVKRVLALPGEQVSMEMRRLLVGGRAVDERGWARYVDPASYPDSGLLDTFYRRRDNFAAARVPTECYFVLGDNRDLSADSRFWGFVPAAPAARRRGRDFRLLREIR